MNEIIKIIDEIIKEKDEFYFNHEYTDGLREAIERIKSLPPTISKEDINKLQRYDLKDETPDYAEMLETDNGEYVRYDSLISLITK